MSRLEQSDKLHARVRALVSAFERGERMPEAFDGLACDIARYQHAHHVGFSRLCRAQGVDVAAIDRAAQIPAVPTDAFKLARIATFPPEEERAVFRTSGTTIGARGVHALRDVGTYQRASVAFGRRMLLGDVGESVRARVLVLGPSPEEVPDSSLGHMNACFVRELGAPSSPEDTYLIRDGVIALDAFDQAVANALVRGDGPLLVLGTSFAFVHLLDALGDDTPFPLPPGARVMQTGGTKGKSRDVSAEALRAQLAATFALPPRAIVTEYGMTELGSQFYERTLVDSRAPEGVLVEPPWARVVPVDPETLEPVRDGDVGIARIVDLVNVDSACVVLAQDRVRRVEGGFELLGRAAGAPPRGCSIGIDEILSASAS